MENSGFNLNKKIPNLATLTYKLLITIIIIFCFFFFFFFPSKMLLVAKHFSLLSAIHCENIRIREHLLRQRAWDLSEIAGAGTRPVFELYLWEGCLTSCLLSYVPQFLNNLSDKRCPARYIWIWSEKQTK